MRAEVDVVNRDRTLRPGMYATVHLNVRDFAGAVAVPATALHAIDGETVVFLVSDGVVHAVPVAIAMDDGARVVVTGDLDAASAVVVAGPPGLREGQRVRTEQR